ncbi:MAG TPA: HAMP domain-containing sensor histidine kinase [Longimicrobiales bacterium]|nr:HAMP domain-containing sensor histidine kinase [Longimicrobiales bacterium]
MKEAEPAAGSAANSQELLARSIAREVQSRLPVSGSHPGLEASVEASVREQARKNELALAYVRAVSVAALALVALVGRARPDLIGVTAVSARVVWIVTLWTFGATAFLVALRRGWYHARLRQLVPAADALLIGLAVLLFSPAGTSAARASLPGVAAIAAIACAVLVFSGSVRLSRSAQRLATLLGTGTWLLLARALGTPILILTFVAALLIVIGVIGSRFGSIVRTVVANQIAGERLAGLYRDARIAVEAREEVLHMVAHDLRNPLSTIGMSAAMLRDTEVESESGQKYLSIISRCSESMTRMIHDLLDVARMEAGRLQVERRDVDATELLDRVVELMRPIAEAEQLRLHSEPRGAGLTINADPDRIQQVFSNLIGNAIKFTPPGGTITLRAQRAGERVRFSVLDTGPGIPPERIESLFEGFWQANAADRRGIGLGLAIARSIVEAHGERIGVENRPGGGSEFWFTATVARASENQ